MPHVSHPVKPTEPPQLTRIDWATFQAFLEDRLHWNLAVSNEEAIDKCIELLNIAIQEVLLTLSFPYLLVFGMECT